MSPTNIILAVEFLILTLVLLFFVFDEELANKHSGRRTVALLWIANVLPLAAFVIPAVYTAVTGHKP